LIWCQKTGEIARHLAPNFTPKIGLG